MTNIQVLEAKVQELEALFTEEFYKNGEEFNGELVTSLGDELLEAKEELKKATKTYKIMTIDEVVQALPEGYYIQERTESTLTLSGAQHHELALTFMDNGSIDCETYNNHAIEHFKTYEWANHKNVKTLKGLKGYMNRFGYDLEV